MPSTIVNGHFHKGKRPSTIFNGAFPQGKTPTTIVDGAFPQGKALTTIVDGAFPQGKTLTTIVDGAFLFQVIVIDEWLGAAPYGIFRLQETQIRAPIRSVIEPFLINP